MEAGANRNILTDQGERPIDLVDPTDMKMISVMLSPPEKKLLLITLEETRFKKKSSGILRISLDSMKLFTSQSEILKLQKEFCF